MSAEDDIYAQVCVLRARILCEIPFEFLDFKPEGHAPTTPFPTLKDSNFQLPKVPMAFPLPAGKAAQTAADELLSAVRLSPLRGSGWAGMGRLFERTGRGETTESVRDTEYSAAVFCYLTAVALRPDKYTHLVGRVLFLLQSAGSEEVAAACLNWRLMDRIVPETLLFWLPQLLFSLTLPPAGVLSVVTRALTIIGRAFTDVVLPEMQGFLGLFSAGLPSAPETRQLTEQMEREQWELTVFLRELRAAVRSIRGSGILPLEKFVMEVAGVCNGNEYTLSHWQTVICEVLAPLLAQAASDPGDPLFPLAAAWMPQFMSCFQLREQTVTGTPEPLGSRKEYTIDATGEELPSVIGNITRWRSVQTELYLYRIRHFSLAPSRLIDFVRTQRPRIPGFVWKLFHAAAYNITPKRVSVCPNGGIYQMATEGGSFLPCAVNLQSRAEWALEAETGIPQPVLTFEMASGETARLQVQLHTVSSIEEWLRPAQNLQAGILLNKIYQKHYRTRSFRGIDIPAMMTLDGGVEGGVLRLTEIPPGQIVLEKMEFDVPRMVALRTAAQDVACILPLLRMARIDANALAREAVYIDVRNGATTILPIKKNEQLPPLTMPTLVQTAFQLMEADPAALRTALFAVQSCLRHNLECVTAYFETLFSLIALTHSKAEGSVYCEEVSLQAIERMLLKELAPEQDHQSCISI